MENELKQVRLILSDFKLSHDGDWLRIKQYADNEDCPIARALKRRFPNKRIYVMTFKAQVGKKDYYFEGEEGRSDFLQEKFLELKGGKKYAIIKLA